MPHFAKAAVYYFAAVFAAAFALGAVRVTVIAPRLGDFWAVALEVPVILALSWGVAGSARRRWPLSASHAGAMGGLAFAFLMVAELGLARLFGQSPRQFFAAMGTSAGALGLAGQMGFALIPVLRGQPEG